MKGRTVLLLAALALVIALVGFYAGMSAGAPKAGADPLADPPGSSVEATQGSGGQASSSKGSEARGSATKGSPPKDSADKASAPKKRKGGNQAGIATQPSHPPAKPPTSKPPVSRPPTSQPQQQPGPVRFGRITTAGRTSDTSIADDRRALTTTFDDFEVAVDPESAEPDATKTFTMTMPLTDGAAGATLRVHAQGYAFLDGDAKASLTLQGGGRQIIQGYGTGADEPFLQTLELPARPGATYQLRFAIDMDRGAGAEGTGYLNIVSIDIGIG